ncbi:MAG TPA: GntR family transcriptional regulator [Fastidiosipila sp.]|nr:GntR family transcriptional regulator [Fastidiosipila sp.]
MKLDKHSSIPLYAQLRELIVERISDGTYEQGDRIPSELQFCEELDLSRPTVRQAIAELVSDGVLEIHKGKGTYVTSEPERLSVPHFTPMTFSFLNLNSYEQIDLKSIKHVESDAELDAVFGLVGKKHPGYWLATWPVVYEGKTHGWCSSYIPVPLFPDLAQAVAAGKRMVDIKSNKYAFLPVKGAVAVLARPAKNKEAQLLEVPRRSFVLIAEGGLYARNGSIVEYIRTAMRPDLIKLEIS